MCTDVKYMGDEAHGQMLKRRHWGPEEGGGAETGTHRELSSVPHGGE